jgi:uncharacterized protein YraI
MRASGCMRLLFGLFALAISTVAAAQNAATNHRSDVYAGPNDSYPVVAELDANAPVQVMGCLDDWSWCDVSFADNRGWLYAPDLTYDYEGDYVPLYTYAPSLGIPVVQFTIGEYWDRYYHGRPWYAQREQWITRAPPHHRRPSGPPPSAGPPPQSARLDNPSHRPGPPPHETQPEHLLRLGGAEPRHSDEHAPPDQRAEKRPEAAHQDKREDKRGHPDERSGDKPSDRPARTDRPASDRSPTPAPNRNDHPDHPGEGPH